MPYSNKLRACSDCRRTFTAVKGEHRCPEHQANWQRRRNAVGQARRPRDHRERAEHQEMVQDWVRLNGWYCPGLDQHLPHPVEPGHLTVHHVQAVAEGGSRVGGAKVVIRRQENSRLGGELRRRPRR